MRKFILLLALLIVSAGIMVYRLQPTGIDISGEWVYGVFDRPTRPGKTIIRQRGNKIRMLVTWTPLKTAKPPHYKIEGAITGNIITGTWIHFGCKMGEKPRQFRAEILPGGQTIRISGTEDPDDHHNFNYVFMHRADRRNPFEF